MLLKKRFIIPIILLILIAIVKADTYSASHKCENDICLQNSTTTWIIDIENQGINDISIDSLKIIDAVTEKSVAFIYYDSPLEVKNGKTESVEIKAELPPENNNLSFDYALCVIRLAPTETWGDIGKTVEYCYPQIYTIPVFQCLNTDMCKEDEFCDDKNQCVPLVCEDCQYIQNHACISFECCESETCLFDEARINNTCHNLDCNVSEVIINHTCSLTACNESEGVIDDVCVKLNCSIDEYIEHHVCVKLNCSFNETFFDETCIPLECNSSQTYLNHDCAELECPYDEEATDHICKKLNCFFILRPHNNFCSPYWARIFQVFLLIIIIILFSKFLKSYIYVRNKKLTQLLYDKVKNKKINKEEKNTNKHDSGRGDSKSEGKSKNA